jgi:glycosyltransferase involved in cell wall biosynthesis
MKNKPELSLVMPTYNEADNIEEVVNRVDRVVKQTGLKYELIVVDDGSMDGTRTKAINCADNNSHIKVIGYGINTGKGYAIKTGFAHATGDAVVFMDSDLDIDPKQIIRYIEALKHGDIVIASKWHPQSSVEIPLMRRFLSHSYNVLVKLLTGIRLKDTQTGLKAVRRQVLEKVFSRLTVKRYAFDAELLAVANLYGLKVVELPVTIRLRSLFNFKDVWKMFLDLLGIAYRLRISKYYQSLRPLVLQEKELS